MGAYEWLEREISFTSKKGSPLEGRDTGYPDIHDECIPIAKNIVQGDLLHDVNVLVRAQGE